MASRKEMIAPCGIDCSICELHLAGEDDTIKQYLLAKGVSESAIPCKGCIPNGGNCPLMTTTCSTFKCTQENEVRFCFECSSFPCTKLYPSSDRADVLPHNLKLLNQAIIQNQGIDTLICNSSFCKKVYFKGKMVIGRGLN